MKNKNMNIYCLQSKGLATVSVECKCAAKYLAIFCGAVPWAPTATKSSRPCDPEAAELLAKVCSFWADSVLVRK